MVSMKDIANQLNISRCTVSNILNHRLEGKSYRKETIDSVLKTAQDMGYVSNSMARGLKTGSTGTIAIVVPDIANTFYIHIIKEVERRANECGYSLIICMAEEVLEKEKSALTMLQSRCVDGVLISPVSYTKSLKTVYPYKTVCFDRTVEEKTFPHVLIDNYSAGYALAEALIHDGSRTPLFLAGSQYDYTVAQRYKGFRDAMAAHGIPRVEENLLYGLYDEQTAYAAITDAIRKNTVFDSLFLCTNYFIYGALYALRENNREIHSLGGFERFSGMRLFGKDVHVVEQPEEAMGRVAFDTLLQMLNGEEGKCEVLPFRIT